jgi:hypothetical protein
VAGAAGTAPPGLLATGDFVGVAIAADHPEHPGWRSAATFTFRRSPTGWTLVGAER